jgi:hypothetical protein
VLTQAIAYSQIFFGGAVVPWLMNSLAAHPARHRQHEAASFLILSSAFCQIVIGGSLALGIGRSRRSGCAALLRVD